MAQRLKGETVDLSAYPDLVVIYLGMRFTLLLRCPIRTTDPIWPT